MTDKKLELMFAPGAFDNFEGTQEELDELIAQIRNMLTDGTLFTDAVEVPPEEAETIARQFGTRKTRQ
jgi:hypothetical protein